MNDSTTFKDKTLMITGGTGRSATPCSSTS